MLEEGPSLRTWALAEEPQSGTAIAAELLPPHRMEYLEYEGPVSGDRGEVERWDRGDYELISATDMELIAQLRGGKLKGPIQLTRESSNAQRWTFLLVAESS